MSPTADDVTRAVASEACRALDASVAKIEHCLAQLTDEQVWWRPREEMNSIGNLLLHLSGNVRQWLVCGIGGAADTRVRPAEFAERGPIPKASLLAGLKDAVGDAKAALDGAAAQDMLARRRVQSFDVTGWGALFDSVPHFQGHTQEIVGLTRMQLGEAYRFHWQPAAPAAGAGTGAS
jgi:hypothetical protein